MTEIEYITNKFVSHSRSITLEIKGIVQVFVFDSHSTTKTESW